jgi:hypothetical protein
MRKALGLILLALAAPATAADLSQRRDAAAAPQTSDDVAEALTTAREAMHAAWLRTPLRVAKAVLVEKGDTGYGIYEPRDSNRYAPGEPIMLYVEPIGYGYGREGEFWRFGLVADLLILDKAGNVLAGKDSALGANFASRNPAKELVFDIIYNLNNAPPGVYVLRTTLRDLYSDEQVRFDIEVEIVPGTAG